MSPSEPLKIPEQWVQELDVDNSGDNGSIRIEAMTPEEAHDKILGTAASTRALAELLDGIHNGVRAMKKVDEQDGLREGVTRMLESRDDSKLHRVVLGFYCPHHSRLDENTSHKDATSERRLVAVSRVDETVDDITATPIVVDDGRGRLEMSTIEAVYRAMFEATEAVGVAMIQCVLARLPARVECLLFARTLPTVVTPTICELHTSAGFESGPMDRLEMTRVLGDDNDEGDQHAWTTDQDEADSQLAGLDIRALDLETDDLARVHAVIQLAFGDEPPSLALWRAHYAQQPRFAPELSFVAWAGDVAVSAVCVERLVDGEGGGDDAVWEILAAAARARTKGLCPTVDDDTDHPHASFGDEFATRKARINSMATVAYVCGVGTLPSHRNRRLAQTLLRRSFRAARALGRLHEFVLGTDRSNLAALRAYEGVGMITTRIIPSSRALGRFVFREPPCASSKQ